jgi:heavy metal sensor kinase
MVFIDSIPVRFRLALAHALWMAALFLIIGFSLYKIVENDLNHSVDAALLSSAQTIKEAHVSWSEEMIHEGGSLDQLFQNPFHVFNQHTEDGHLLVNPFFQIVNISGKIYLKSENTFLTLPLTPQSVERAQQGAYYYESFVFKDRAPLRQITLPISVNGQFTGDLIQVGTSLRPIMDTLRGTALLLLFTLSFVLFVSMILGYALTAQALAPVRNISQAASKMGIDDLSIRLTLPRADDELKELSKTFNAMLDRLEDAVNRLRRFTADVSHELRTPLAVIRGESEFAIKKERDGEAYRRALTTISKESVHMSGIVEDLLFLAKAESRALTQNWMKVNASEFLDELHESVSNIYKLREVSLIKEVDFPGGSFICSKGHLSLALKNILLNAAKHSPSQSQVVISLVQQKQHLLFSIKDTGEGIAAEDLPYIFDPFFRADSARNRAAGGVGIGLCLTQALIKLHQGEIIVSSELGKGTSFTAKIPLLETTG